MTDSHPRGTPHNDKRGDCLICDTIADMEEAEVRARRHWLLFDNDQRITGCHCGFEADTDSDCGFGDSVVIHLIAVGLR